MASLNKSLEPKTIGLGRIKNAIRGLASRKNRRKAFRAALVRAYSICGSRYYPDWAAFLLDKEFQARGASRLKACYLEETDCPSPGDLGKLWADQVLMPWLSDKTKERYVMKLAGVAAGFLRRLEAEMCAERDLRAVLACTD